MLFETHVEAEAASVLASHSPSAVVAVPIFEAPDESIACFRTILRHTPAIVPMLVVDDGSTDRSAIDALHELAAADINRDRLVLVYSKRQNVGFVDSANLIFSLCGRADVTLVNSDVEVAAGWFTGLQAAARASTLTASASALSNNGGILSTPNRNEPSPNLPHGLTLEDVAARIAAGSPRLRPRIPTAVGHCVYIRRLALDAVGLFDLQFSPGYEEEVDWSRRAESMGFAHVAADDVYVFHKGGASFGESPILLEQRRRNLHELSRRYPYHLTDVRDVEKDATSPLACSLLASRRSIGGLNVVVDGMCLGRHQTGTQTLVVNLTRALANEGKVRSIRLLIPGDLPDYAESVLGSVEKVSMIRTFVGSRSLGEAADVVLRPYQLSSISEVEWLRGLGDRLVLVQLDLIAYGDPAYFAGYYEWQAYKDLQRLGLRVADGVGFISDTVRVQSRRESLVSDDSLTRVLHLGVDEGHAASHGEARPARCEALSSSFLLVLGATFLHKNRVWTLKLTEELLRRRWQGHLVLAGPSPSYGSSQHAEREYLRTHPGIARSVIDLGPVTSAEKEWLYRHSALVLYPTLTEGFGMVPFEAATYGTPCLSTRQGSLDEVMPSDMLTLDSLDISRASDLVLRILEDQEVREKMVAALVARRSEYHWERTGSEMSDLLWASTGRPRSNVVALEGPRDRVTLRPVRRGRWVRRVVDPVATSARRSPSVQTTLLPPTTVRGRLARRLYHRLIGDP